MTQQGTSNPGASGIGSRKPPTRLHTYEGRTPYTGRSSGEHEGFSSDGIPKGDAYASAHIAEFVSSLLSQTGYGPGNTHARRRTPARAQDRKGPFHRSPLRPAGASRPAVTGDAAPGEYPLS